MKVRVRVRRKVRGMEDGEGVLGGRVKEGVRERSGRNV